MKKALAVFIGGALGGISRYGIDLWLHDATSLLGTLV
jgi:fluoride ion exporter CrcB/FEX